MIFDNSWYTASAILSVGSLKNLICLFASCSKASSGTKRAGLDPAAFLMAVLISRVDNPKKN